MFLGEVIIGLVGSLEKSLQLGKDHGLVVMNPVLEGLGWVKRELKQELTDDQESTTVEKRKTGRSESVENRKSKTANDYYSEMAKDSPLYESYVELISGEDRFRTKPAIQDEKLEKILFDDTYIHPYYPNMTASGMDHPYARLLVLYNLVILPEKIRLARRGIKRILRKYGEEGLLVKKREMMLVEKREKETSVMKTHVLLNPPKTDVRLKTYLPTPPRRPPRRSRVESPQYFFQQEYLRYFLNPKKSLLFIGANDMSEGQIFGFISHYNRVIFVEPGNLSFDRLFTNMCTEDHRKRLVIISQASCVWGAVVGRPEETAEEKKLGSQPKKKESEKAYLLDNNVFTDIPDENWHPIERSDTAIGPATVRLSDEAMKSLASEKTRTVLKKTPTILKNDYSNPTILRNPATNESVIPPRTIRLFLGRGNAQSSSIMGLDLIPESFRLNAYEVVPAYTAKEILEANWFTPDSSNSAQDRLDATTTNLRDRFDVFIDTQGAEVGVIKGFTKKYLDLIDLLVIEVNIEANFIEVHRYLTEHGFHLRTQPNALAEREQDLVYTH